MGNSLPNMPNSVKQANINQTSAVAPGSAQHVNRQNQTSLSQRVGNVRDQVGHVQQRDKAVETLVKFLESKLQVKAPGDNNDAKLEWLKGRLEEQNIQDQVNILKELGENAAELGGGTKTGKSVVQDFQKAVLTGLKEKAKHDSVFEKELSLYTDELNEIEFGKQASAAQELYQEDSHQFLSSTDEQSLVVKNTDKVQKFNKSLYNHMLQSGVVKTGEMFDVNHKHEKNFKKVADNTGSKKSNILAKILKETKLFWNEENKFWMDLNAAGNPDPDNQSLLNEKLAELGTLEMRLATHFDVDVNDLRAFKEGGAERRGLRAELSSIKEEIAALHGSMM